MLTFASTPPSLEILARLDAVIQYLEIVAGPDDDLLHKLQSRRSKMISAERMEPKPPAAQLALAPVIGAGNMDAISCSSK